MDEYVILWVYVLIEVFVLFLLMCLEFLVCVGDYFVWEFEFFDSLDGRYEVLWYFVWVCELVYGGYGYVFCDEIELVWECFF